MNMRKLAAALALLGSCALAHAQNDNFPAASDRVQGSRPFIDSEGQKVYIVRNANDCAPFQAKAVWARGGHSAAPAGYRCFHNSNR
jgi:hypothetical protein